MLAREVITPPLLGVLAVVCIMEMVMATTDRGDSNEGRSRRNERKSEQVQTGRLGHGIGRGIRKVLTGQVFKPRSHKDLWKKMMQALRVKGAHNHKV